MPPQKKKMRAILYGRETGQGKGEKARKPMTLEKKIAIVYGRETGTERNECPSKYCVNICL